MKRARRLLRSQRRWMGLTICFLLVLPSLILVPGQTTFGKRSSLFLKSRGQGNGQSRRVMPVPPQLGPPAANLPNLDELKQRQNVAPRAAVVAPSMMRSRRKPLEPRNGRRVGDPLPPIVRPSPRATPSALPALTPLPTPSALPTPGGVATPTPIAVFRGGLLPAREKLREAGLVRLSSIEWRTSPPSKRTSLSLARSRRPRLSN